MTHSTPAAMFVTVYKVSTMAPICIRMQKILEHQQVVSEPFVVLNLLNMGRSCDNTQRTAFNLEPHIWSFIGGLL